MGRRGSSCSSLKALKLLIRSFEMGIIGSLTIESLVVVQVELTLLTRKSVGERLRRPWIVFNDSRGFVTLRTYHAARERLLFCARNHEHGTRGRLQHALRHAADEKLLTRAVAV